MAIQEILHIRTQGRGTTDITGQVRKIVSNSGTRDGLCHIFVHHTSASLMLCENADPTVRSDLEQFMSRLVPDGDVAYQHRDEGEDDMPAHIRSVLTQTGLCIPVVAGQCGLGTWQGVYLWEHRYHGHQRKLTVSVTALV